MTTTSTRPVTRDVNVARITEQLIASATNNRSRIAIRALAAEETLLSRDNVRRVLVTKDGSRLMARWENLSGRLYTLGLDETERAFLGLVLSIVGIGHITIAAAEDLDERRLVIVQQAILEIAGNDRIAIGTRL
ncbi:hypothetical protein [Streptomyces sp. YIM S03343]